MKKWTFRGIIILMMMAFVFTMMPQKASAASKKPGKVKITTYKVSKVSKSSSTVKITLRWKKVKNASSYEIWEKHGTGEWRLMKISRGIFNGLRIRNVPTGKYSLKVRAVRKVKGKKYYGKFSKVKTKFSKSSMTLEELANRYPEMKEMRYNGLGFSYRGNTVVITLDISSDPDFANATLAQVKFVENNLYNDLGTADVLASVENIRSAVKDNTGVTNVGVRIEVIFKGEFITARDY